MIFIIRLIGKAIIFVSRILNIGSGGTWPGEIALKLKKDIFGFYLARIDQGLILITGTNGKTTTAKLVENILNEEAKIRSSGQIIVSNPGGGNIFNGLVSAFIDKLPLISNGHCDWAILEVDEATFSKISPLLKNYKNKLYILMLNLFRDQLDRYGEVDLIASKWQKALKNLPPSTEYILNADDPQITHLGRMLKDKVTYFGINDGQKGLILMEHATDSIYCLNCGAKLTYSRIYFSHLGIWHCSKCGNSRPKATVSDWKSALPGIYNKYNTLAAAAMGIKAGISDDVIKKAFRDFKPAFGRQEEIIYQGRKIKLFLAKNPTGFNINLRTVIEMGAKSIFIILNDRIPDGRDVSWIWDVDYEIIPKNVNITVSGDRTYDLAVRIKYSKDEYESGKNRIDGKFQINSNLNTALQLALQKVGKEEMLFVLPTYSAMLEIRKIIGGRKIL
jgi:lipid II isoglutaminyl synthase (glutamine-hydrolysing)